MVRFPPIFRTLSHQLLPMFPSMNYETVETYQEFGPEHLHLVNLRQCESFNSFCYMLKTNSQHNIPKYFNDGKRKCSIIHSRLRNFCSNLNQDLFDNHLRIDPTCSCQRNAETAEHYFFRCEHNTDQRIRIFRDTHEFHPLNINALLQGKETLSDNDNSRLFHHVQTYIHSTGRFTN